MNNILGTVLLAIFAIAVAIVGYIIVMMFGWGLAPVSWAWIICPTLISAFIIALINSVNEK